MLSKNHYSLDEVESLAAAILSNAGASKEAASSVARSTRLAEHDGIRSHGLMYLPIYKQHLDVGKVIGSAKPVVARPKNAAICVDAQNGFAHTAIDAGWTEFITAASEHGIAAMTIYNSYNCGVLGHHAERIARDKLVGLCFTHAPASIAPWGGSKAVIGTNPIALSVPNQDGEAAFVIDQSASVIAKSEIILRSEKGEPIEEGWAVDHEGNPTLNAKDALAGSLLPSGGYKGFGIGLIVEVLASVLSGANLSQNASPFSGTLGGPPSTGQCFIAIDPLTFSGIQFFDQIKTLSHSISSQEYARLPGQKRLENRKKIDQNGVYIDEELWGHLNALLTN